jgi:UDP-glucuronate decarboxylase
MAVRMTGSKSKLEYRALPEDDPKQRRPDITVAGRVLDWKPTVKLEDGLRKTIEYFDNFLRRTN